MAMEQFLRWLADNWAGVTVVLSLFIQVSPIKWNPWSSLFKWIGKTITADVMKELQSVKEAQKQQQRETDENEKNRIRHEVLSFANECRRDIKHTKEEFDHVISLKSRYDKILKRTGDENGVFTADYEFIQEIYHKCLRENKFL